MNIIESIAAYKKQTLQKQKEVLPLTTIQQNLKPSARNFAAAIQGKNTLSIIAEIKKASPEDGLLREDFDHKAIAAIYEKYADAISINTDETFFQGNVECMKDVETITTKPLLRRDLIIDEYQIYEARYFGANAILIISALIDTQTIQKYIDIAAQLNMDAIVEVHNEEELNKVLPTTAKIIGVNNRNPDTFSVDMNTTLKLKELIPADKILISESSIQTINDLNFLKTHVDAVLIGASLMKSPNIEATLQSFIAVNG